MTRFLVSQQHLIEQSAGSTMHSWWATVRCRAGKRMGIASCLSCLISPQHNCSCFFSAVDAISTMSSACRRRGTCSTPMYAAVFLINICIKVINKDGEYYRTQWVALSGTSPHVITLPKCTQLWGKVYDRMTQWQNDKYIYISSSGRGVVLVLVLVLVVVICGFFIFIPLLHF